MLHGSQTTQHSSRSLQVAFKAPEKESLMPAKTFKLWGRERCLDRPPLPIPLKASERLLLVLYTVNAREGFPADSSEESTRQCRRCKRLGFSPSIGQIPWNRKWQPAPVFLPGKFHGQRSLVGYSPRVTMSQTQLSRRAHTAHNLPEQSYRIIPSIGT